MTFVSLLALVVLVAIAAWIFGSALLRLLGIFLIVASLLVVATGGSVSVGIATLVMGLVAWLGGHWLFAFRHHVYAGPLPERVFLQLLPARLDPTRNWS